MRNILHFQYKVWIACVGLFMLYNTTVLAQEQETEKVRDSTSTTFSFSKMSLPDPDSIQNKYEYDPFSDRYIYSETLGDFDIRYPLFLTPDQFQKQISKEQIRDYFKEKTQALSGKGADAEEKKKNLLPIFYVNSNFFESIFGGNEIEIIPQGSVEVDLGLLYNKQDNPSFSPRNQSNITFDFDQRISLSLQGNIGTRLSVLANYDTESTFDFQNQLKLQYNPTEDDIIQAIELGNVSLPLNSSLIQGAQSLFGIKAQLQFGKTTITGIFSEQRSETRSVSVEGGGTVEDFEIFALDYDENRHYFLSQFFRETYDESLRNYPFINSNIQITRVQVWLTNRSNNTRGLTNARNLVAIQDLGESNPNNIGVLLNNEGEPNSVAPVSFVVNNNELPQNRNNLFNPVGITDNSQRTALTPAIRDIAFAKDGFGTFNGDVREGIDYSILEGARLLNENEFRLNTQLGYISLNQRLNNDEILGVAFQYTKGGEVFQVGEFANDGVSNTQTGQSFVDENGDSEDASPTQSLVVKMLKSSVTAVTEPVWDLMMKNIYDLGVFRLNQEDFRLNILYTNPSPVNFITPAPGAVAAGSPLPSGVDNTTLLKVFNMDRLNNNNDPVNGGDGFFDFFPGITIEPENGRVVFTTVQPFGSHLFERLRGNSGASDYENRDTYNLNQKLYVFEELYNNTKIGAQQIQADKNKFQLKGKYKTTGQNGISIGAFNVPRGSVRVSAGGRLLQEGLDYTVNYQLGRVQILNEALLASNTPIDISTENNAVFGQQTKRFSGINVEHKFSKDFVLGATLLNLRERPLTQKSNLNFEPINNTIVGLNGNYSTEVPFLTRMVNKLPNIDTEAPSNFSFRGEFAYLFANAPNAADFNGEVTSYIDDFEGAQTRIDISSPLSWELSSVPESSDGGPTFSPGQRAALSWYSIDPIFYSRQRPDGISDSELSRPQVRRVFVNEIFPNTQIAQNQTRAQFTLDLHYRPDERGSYNYNTAFEGADKNTSFGGITRALTTTNFEQSNIEFIEFWLLNPFDYLENNTGGKLVFNIGNISEDVLADGRKLYENGLPEEAVAFNVDSNDPRFRDANQRRVPRNQSLVYAFDTDGGARVQQDAGFDGLKDAQETVVHGSTFGPDPSNDNYEYFLQASGSIENRYKRYNGTDGDSPTEVSQTNRGRTTLPTVEDVNRDNTMNTIDQYLEYTVDILPTNLNEGNPYVSDIRNFQGTAQDGSPINSQWVQFKIPLSDSPIRTAINGATDLRSARFLRMYMTDFSQETLLRFGTLDLVRGNYRRFTPTDINGVRPANNTEPPVDTGGLNTNVTVGDFEVSSVSIEENPSYVVPPGIVREQLNNNNTILAQDERSLALTVKELATKDARAVFNNLNVDMRQYENLELFIHAEAAPNEQLADSELVAIVRVGNDFTDNYYQIELPLEVTPVGARNPDAVWPTNNRLNLPLSLLQRIKARANALSGQDPSNRQRLVFYDNNAEVIAQETIDSEGLRTAGELRVGIKGNPSFGDVRVLMLGVKNGAILDKSGTVWFNEMRLSGLKNQGGWAAVANVDANIADFANITASGRRSTVGFGSIEQGPNERSREDVAQYDFTTSVNLGQLLPKKWGIKLPVSYSRGEELITPQFDPLNQDLLLEDVLDSAASAEERDRIEEQSTEYTKRQSISAIGVRKERTGDKKPMPYDIENFTFSGTYNQTDHRDFEIEEALDQSLNLGGNYNFAFAPWEIEPLKKTKYFQKGKYWQLLRDFNINPLPTNISFSSNLNRQYNEQKFRDVSLAPGSIGLETLKQRNFLTNWQYAINYNLTKSFNFNFTSAVNRIVRNYIDEDNNVNDAIDLWSGPLDFGDANSHNQSLQANYELPFSKIPALKFIKSTYSYTGDFQWQKGSDVFRSLEDEGIGDLGNTIQNSSVNRLNNSLDMKKLYKYIGFVKRTSNIKKKKKKKKKDSIGGIAVPKIAPRTLASRKKVDPKKLNSKVKAYNTLVGIVTAVKRININYQQDAGTVLPGYINNIGFLGTLKPTTAFTFGGQGDVRNIAAQNGWLTTFDEFNQQYQHRTSNQLDVQATVDLIQGLKIDITANRGESSTYTENFIVDSDLQYQSLTPNTFGNFNISTILIKTAFQKSDQATSQAFESFKDNRLIIANRLAGGASAPRGEDGVFPEGYGRNNQAVLLPAFLAAYSGTSADKVSTGAFRNVPLPNWNIKYTGLMKKKWFKERFKRFSLAHGYRSDYTVNRFQTNLDFDPNRPASFQLDQSGNFKNEILYGNIALTEQFSPLINIDVETKGAIKISTEIRKDRALSFSFDNSLLTEIQGNEYIIGLGYRIKDISFSSRLGNGQRRLIKSDLNLKLDMSLRQNETIIRNLDVDNSQVTSGQDIYSLRFTSDYALSKNLTALFFYDHSFSKFSVSTAFPQTNIRGGFTLRYNFGN